MSTKEKCQKRHAKQRAWQRYDLELTDTQYNHMCHMIRNREATGLYKQSNRVSIWKVKYLGIEWIAVYDKHRDTIASFLPPGLKTEDIKNWHGDNFIEV